MCRLCSSDLSLCQVGETVEEQFLRRRSLVSELPCFSIPSARRSSSTSVHVPRLCKTIRLPGVMNQQLSDWMDPVPFLTRANIVLSVESTLRQWHSIINRSAGPTSDTQHILIIAPYSPSAPSQFDCPHKFSAAIMTA